MTMTGMTAALAALALGGSAIATAAQGTPKKPAVEQTTVTDTDSVQSGDQTTPDATGATAASAAASENAAETSGESTESSEPSDGPGGPEETGEVNSETQE
jgi:hypothetical protein